MGKTISTGWMDECTVWMGSYPAHASIRKRVRGWGLRIQSPLSLPVGEGMVFFVFLIMCPLRFLYGGGGGGGGGGLLGHYVMCR